MDIRRLTDNAEFTGDYPSSIFGTPTESTSSSSSTDVDSDGPDAQSVDVSGDKTDGRQGENNLRLTDRGHSASFDFRSRRKRRKKKAKSTDRPSRSRIRSQIEREKSAETIGAPGGTINDGHFGLEMTRTVVLTPKHFARDPDGKK